MNNSRARQEEESYTQPQVLGNLQSALIQLSAVYPLISATKYDDEHVLSIGAILARAGMRA